MTFPYSTNRDDYTGPLLPKRSINTIQKGVSVFAGAVTLVVTLLAAGSFALAMTISPWWFIAVAVFGGYALISAIWLYVVRMMLKSAGQWR